jgi:hypothetical protein
VLKPVRELAQQHSTEAIRTLVSIMNDEDQDARARVAAANAILDRGYGKPQQNMNLSGEIRAPDPVVLVHTAPPPPEK